ncbi:hypothetical protein FSP39_012586 [Pinctada imbricata]|uniref:Uncharacterized protein n=1 Tax=Pinctada imbricata TaxID=66713 RepID=A0AA88YAM1_PINIB|nr:hypothetical protein FSP39_012586 [Pinctada imbricata]
MPKKHYGRVGDSALPGSGLYANEFGAACCSGDGDEILKFCPAFHAVHLMSSGMTPQHACEEVVESIRTKTENTIEIGMIAANVKGEFGASTTVKSWTDPLTGSKYQGFPYVVMTSAKQQPIIALAEVKL